MSRIYLDNNATTALAPEVREAIDLCWAEPLNPSSTHYYGQKAKKMLMAARESIATSLGVKPRELIFTSGATEAMQLALPKGQILTTNLEHAATWENLQETKLIDCGLYGSPTAAAIQQAIDENTAAIVISAVNSETGAKANLEEIAAISGDIPLIVDGVQLLGKEPFHIPPGVDAMTFSAHKLHGPKGVGALFSRKKLKPKYRGGFQERGMRPGTENLAGIVGFAKALEISSRPHQMAELRDLFESLLPENAQINCSGPRICNTTNVYFEGIDGETLNILLDKEGVSASQGSACSSGSLEPSRVLLGMGYSRQRAKSSLRFSLSRYTTREEIERASKILNELTLSLSCSRCK
ncbi:MAG: cysteine desulfurase [Simkaniaceae bacterium]|nr:cysteine desulfurase [Simkaniaceae bacterium]